MSYNLVMLKNWLLWVLLCCVSAVYAQQTPTPYKTRKTIAVQDTIRIDSVSINPSYFKIQDQAGKAIDTTLPDYRELDDLMGQA